MGSGAKVVAISNRLDGGLFKSLDTLEPSTKLNGSVLQGLNFSGASGMAGDTAVVMDANSNTFAFIYQLPGGALPATPQDRAVIATRGKHTSWRRHSYNVSRFIPDFSEWRIEADLAFTPNNMGQSLFCAVVMCSNKAAGSYAIAYQRSDQSAVTSRQVTGYTIPAYSPSQK